jgi:hypothetical protein
MEINGKSFGLEHLFVLQVFLFFELLVLETDTSVSVLPVDFSFLLTFGVLDASLEGGDTLAELRMHLVNVGLDVVGAERTEVDHHVKGLVVASGKVDLLFKLHRNHTGVTLEAGSFFKLLQDGLRYAQFLREILDGHSRFALLGVLKLNAESVGKLLFHLGVEVQLEVDGDAIFVALEHPVALIRSVVNLARREGLLFFHAGVDAVFHGSAKDNTLEVSDFMSNYIGSLLTLFITSFLLSTLSEFLLLLFSPVSLHVELLGQGISGNSEVYLEVRSVQ